MEGRPNKGERVKGILIKQFDSSKLCCYTSTTSDTTLPCCNQRALAAVS